MEIIDCIELIKKFFKYVLGSECRVITAVRTDSVWNAEVEVMLDRDYTTRKGLGDMVEIYEVYLNEKEILSYKHKATKRKAELEES